mgnify:CR=1 FL=1
MSSSWGWWLPKKQEYETDEEEKEEEYIPYDEISDLLNEARYHIEQAIEYLIERRRDEVHECIRNAHQNLREASRLLGYRPT